MTSSEEGEMVPSVQHLNPHPPFLSISSLPLWFSNKLDTFPLLQVPPSFTLRPIDHTSSTGCLLFQRSLLLSCHPRQAILARPPPQRCHCFQPSILQALQQGSGQAQDPAASTDIQLPLAFDTRPGGLSSACWRILLAPGPPYGDASSLAPVSRES